jgi:hypothetical protein
MCDYSLESVQSRPAKVGDRLTTRLFRTSTRGFSAPENKYVAVCLLPGTELSFANEVRRIRLWPWNTGTIKHKTAIFREINQGIPRAHHDALEFPDGQIVLLTLLQEGQQATVLQLRDVLPDWRSFFRRSKGKHCSGSCLVSPRSRAGRYRCSSCTWIGLCPGDWRCSRLY